MAEDLNKKILDWLNKGGFPLEMETGSIARSCGFEVSQSDYYLDQETGESREIDLVLTKSAFVVGQPLNYSVSYTMCVECKSGKDKPWLIFVNENRVLRNTELLEAKQLVDGFIVNDLAEALLWRGLHRDGLKDFYPHDNTFSTIGYGVTEALISDKEKGNSKNNQRDVPFTALMSATKASLFYQKRYSMHGFSVPFCIVIPVIVIDAPLYTVLYDTKSEKIKIEEAKRGLLLLKHAVANVRSRINVYIIQRQELESFLKECALGASHWIHSDVQLLNEIAASNGFGGAPQK